MKRNLLTMRLTAELCIILVLMCTASATERDEAHGTLIRRKRANAGWLEELKKGNLERECLEEKCSYEEAREVFEHTEATNEFWKLYNVKDHCASNPCENNGVCANHDAESYICLCQAGFNGRNCDQVVKDVPDSCRYDNGLCEHFCVEERTQRNCSCADGYFLAPDAQNCVTHEAFPCGKIPLLQGVSAAKSPEEDPRSRIVGGAECPKGHCPWQVLLKYGNKGFCGGVIIKSTWILTAAHCMEKIKANYLKIVAGEHDIEADEGTEQVIQVERIITHPGYVSESADNDIALLRLQRPVSFSPYAVPVCLPLKSMAERELWAVHMHTECVQSSNVSLTPNMFCAGYVEGKQDSCKGDSGGPLVTRYGNTTFLLGIVSWGKGCARPGFYGIYTRVSNYLRWIREHTVNSTLQWYPHLPN